jgi:hypothetical protein
VSCVLTVVHLNLSKWDCSKKYDNPNNKTKEIKITIVCQSMSVWDFCEALCICNKESTSIECRGVVRRDCKLSSAFNVSGASSRSWWESCCEIIGTLSGMKIYGVLSSVCMDPRRVGYICRSSVDIWQAVALNSSPVFMRTCVHGGLASFPGQRIVSCRGVGK